MREFIYFSKDARTTGNFDLNELMKAGRMDIACHVVIAALFLSHEMRRDVKLHLAFNGQPDPPKHLEMFLGKEQGDKENVEISKKDVANLIKKMLYKHRAGERTEVWNGFFIEKKSLFNVIENMKKDGKEVYLLDRKGEDIRSMNIAKDCVFLVGDHDGLPKKELKRLKERCKAVSIGKKTYFASQVVVIVNNELDRREV